jgi:hypothetical protein
MDFDESEDTDEARWLDSELDALLSSGLPFPKSPSLQQQQEDFIGDGGCSRREREERGWWTVRFQQILRELLRK